MTNRRRPSNRAGTRPPTPTGNARPPSALRREGVILAAIGILVLAVAALAAVLMGGRAGGPTSSAPVGALGSGQTASGLSPAAGSPGSSGAGSDRLVYPDSPTLGPTNAPATLVEFLDPECEACRAAYPIVKQLLADYDGRLRLVVRYVPGHGNSALAAAAVEEAGRQGRYWEALEYFFEQQPEWGEQQQPQTEAFLRYGTTLGLDVEKLRAALASPDLRKVERDAADAQALGVRGTPTFFVDGKMVQELSEQALRAAIDEAVKE